MSNIDVETVVDKALEQAEAELRDALVDLGRDALQGDLSFRELEHQFAGTLLTFARSMLAAMLSLYDRDEPYLEHEGTIWRHTETVSKTYRSIWGPLEVERSVYRKRGESAGPQLVPLELQAGLIEGEWTPHCAEAIARMVQSVPTREACRNMEVVGILPDSRSGFDRVVEALGETWEANRCDLEEEVIEAVEVPEEAEGISVAYDRACIQMDETTRAPEEWPNGRRQPREIEGRMAYCGTVTLHDSEGEPLWTKRYGRPARASEAFDGPGAGEWIVREQLKWDVEALVERAPRLSDQAAALCDGGPELERMLEEDFPDWTQLCDLRHLSSYLSAALDEASEAGEIEDPEQQRRVWIEQLKQEDGAIEEIEQTLHAWEAREGGDIEAARTYIENRRDRLLNYSSAHQKGLPIASGHVEATCKSLIEMRMRRSGARWTPDAAERMLTFRSLALSKTWATGMSALLERFEDDSFERCDELCDRAAA